MGKNTGAPKATYTFPWLNERIADAVAPDLPSTFFNTNKRELHGHEYETNIMGRFICTTPNCAAKGWGSTRVSILIKGFVGNGYHATVFGQRCRQCKNLGLLKMDEDSYVDRVAYRLKKWANIEVTPPPYKEKQGPPHETELCEGCKRGHCTLGD